MNKFETIGVNYQYLAQTVEQATKSLMISCNACTHSTRCLYKDCEHCPIQMTHNLVVASLSDSVQEEN